MEEGRIPRRAAQAPSCRSSLGMLDTCRVERLQKLKPSHLCAVGVGEVARAALGQANLYYTGHCRAGREDMYVYKYKNTGKDRYTS